jgi:enoyl-CoA hydratase/carnithine racemase
MQSESSKIVEIDYTSLNDSPVAIVTLNRPQTLNALNESLIVALEDALTRLEERADVAVMIITGAGRAFSAGGDMKAYSELYYDKSAYGDLLQLMARVFQRIEHSPVVSVAMINGTCVAGGLELALCCDLMTIAEEAAIGDGHLLYWQLPGAGGVTRLISHIGLAAAKHLLLTAGTISANSAVDRGLAVLSAPSSDLLSATLALVADIASRPREVNAEMKKLISYVRDDNADNALRREREHVLKYVSGSNSWAVRGLERFHLRLRSLAARG